MVSSVTVSSRVAAVSGIDNQCLRVPMEDKPTGMTARHLWRLGLGVVGSILAAFFFFDLAPLD